MVQEKRRTMKQRKEKNNILLGDIAALQIALAELKLLRIADGVLLVDNVDVFVGHLHVALVALQTSVPNGARGRLAAASV
jgi:hypothetical protein